MGSCDGMLRSGAMGLHQSHASCLDHAWTRLCCDRTCFLIAGPPRLPVVLTPAFWQLQALQRSTHSSPPPPPLQHQASWRGVAKEHPYIYVRFINMMINDSQFLLQEALETLPKVSGSLHGSAP